jgi:putative DNA primase/helicase
MKVERSAGGAIVLEESAPYDSARVFAEVQYGGETLRHWQGQFYRYDGKCWRVMEQGELRQELYKFLDGTIAKTRAGHERFQPDLTKVNKVVDALAALVNLPNLSKVPAWIGGPGEVPAEELVAVQNGLLHLRTRKLWPHTPRFFNLSVLEFSYDPDAECPGWKKFQGGIWGGDTEAAAAVQEMFGLCITDQTRFQKAFMVIGPKRSGKGTMGRVLRRLVGEDNYVGPKMSGFVKQFGMQNWIGKKVAVFSDARLEQASDAATELLLATTGEDVQDVERKYLTAWTGTLGTRIVVLTNELPRFKDESAVLPTRFIVLQMTRSFFGQEDIHLTDKLVAELPGIMNWALDRWDALMKRGHLVQPKSGKAMAEALLLAASNIRSFVEEKCEVGPDYRIECQALLQACQSWNESRRLRFTLEVNQFSRQLKEAYPQVGTERPRDTDDEKRPRYFAGIRLRVQAQQVVIFRRR